MKFPSFQKISLLLFFFEQNRGRVKGTSTLWAVFIFLIFSTLGLSMLHLTQIYIKLSSFKKNSLLLGYASENGIKQGFTQLFNMFMQSTSPIILSEEKEIELKQDALNMGLKTLQMISGQDLPLLYKEHWKQFNWETLTTFYPEKIQDKNDYFNAIYLANIYSEGKLDNFSPKRASSLEVSIGISVGKIPLPMLPVLLEKKLRLKEKENFLEENNIELLPSSFSSTSTKMNFSEEKILPKEAPEQLNKALKTEIFYPQNLSPAQVRRALGLEESNDPIPQGVYLIKDDLGLGGLFVQGDVDEMILAIQDSFQVISFLTSEGAWILRFNPHEQKTIFSTPAKIESYDFNPRGIIVVNGEIKSLGGGFVEPTGEITMVSDETPCILQGINLTLISSDKITISSHILHQGITWQEGVPYAKDSTSQLVIFTTGQDFLDESLKEGKIIIGEDSPQDIKIQASITAAGNGFAIQGKGKTVHISGSLHISDYSSNNNELKISFDDRFLTDESLLENAPKTTKPVLSILFFKTQEWKDMI